MLPGGIGRFSRGPVITVYSEQFAYVFCSVVCLFNVPIVRDWSRVVTARVYDSTQCYV